MIILPLINMIDIYEKNIGEELSDSLILTGGINWETKKINKEFISDPKKIYLKLATIEQKNSTIIQLFNRNVILSKEHLIYALYFTNRAFILKKNISKSRSLEYLLYVSQQRQINLALDLVGFFIDPKESTQKIAFSVSGIQNDDIITSFESIKLLLGIENPIISEIKSTNEKIKILMGIYGISDFELENSLKSMGCTLNNDKNNIENESLINALLQCLKERMSLLSTEK